MKNLMRLLGRSKNRQERMQENVRNVNEKQEKKTKKNEFVNMWLVKKHCKKQPKIITHLHIKKFFFC